MFTTIADFERAWVAQSGGTVKLLAALTDESLAQQVAPQSRTLGRLAWHITGSIAEMANRTGLRVTGPAEDAPVPAKAAEILAAYEKSARSLGEQVRKAWTDATLVEEDEMYGEPWKRGHTLYVLIQHETHHRGQMSVLMRQAGLQVAGVCGPSREEWAAFGMPAAAI
jgi:uncharacterized damage-inducible protein DinB